LDSGSSSTRKFTTSLGSRVSTQEARPSYTRRVLVCLVLSHCISSTHTLCTCVAGKDATQAFFGLHRHEVLLRPQYARLQIGTLKGASELVSAPAPDALSAVPYAEPTWLSKGFHSPYFTDSHKRFQKAVRKFIQEVVFPEAIKCEEKGTRISQEVVDKLACATFMLWR
jgi:hypothetical protein